MSKWKNNMMMWHIMLKEKEELFEADDIYDEEEESREREQDDELLDEGRKENDMDEEAEGSTSGKINIRKFEAGEMKDAAYYILHGWPESTSDRRYCHLIHV